MIDPAFADLDEDIVQQLTRHYTSTKLPGEAGQPVDIGTATRISKAQGRMIYDLILEHRPTRTLEIGMAFGFSTLWIIAALRRLDGARHTAIDPYERGHWRGVGVQTVRQLGFEARFRLIEESSAIALPKLLVAKERFEFVFIDGDHLFDSVMVDFYFADKICPIDGLIVFDDMWMPSIRKATAFILNNLHYDRVDTNVANALVIRKTAHDDRSWQHFVDFNM